MRINHLLIAVSCLSAAAIAFSLPRPIVGAASAAGGPAVPLTLRDHFDDKLARSDAAGRDAVKIAARDTWDRRSGERSDRSQHADGRDSPLALPLAQRLSALEVQIGIRADQLNAWRDYAATLIELVEPAQSLKRPGERNGIENAPGSAKDPFDREQKLADAFVRRAAVAERLKGAITTLRAALTPEQLARLTAAGQSKWVRLSSAPFDKPGSRPDERETAAKSRAEEAKSGPLRH